MKLHKPLVVAIVQTLYQIFENGAYADKAVEQVLKQNSKWGSRDRRFIASTVYEIVRHWRLLSAIVGEDSFSYYKVIALLQLLNGVELPDWKEFKEINRNTVLQKAIELSSIRKYRESVPDWLDNLGIKELGEKVWERELHELNKEAKVVLRANTLKTKKIKLQQLLKKKSIETETSEKFPDALIIIKRQNLYQLDEYKQGLFEIQDASSQLIVPFMQLEKGMTVIDACAGAGGKSLHIASLMQNKGKIISMDVEEKKLAELKKRADRAGASGIEIQKINPAIVTQLKSTADRLLIDAPCSGLGVLRRNPDAKWKLSFDFINEIRRTQQKIINDYSQILKVGGIMVYATCSILPCENEKQVEQFLNSEKNNFEFMRDRRVMPSEGFDGFYMAAIKKIK